jgi:hypothetical protein
MNMNVLSINQRVSNLEAGNRGPPAAPAAPAAPPRRNNNVVDGGLRARFQNLDLNGIDAGAGDDEWEVAGAGAAPPGKQLKSGALIAAQHDVKVQLDYPHKHVLRGAGRPAPLALDLSMAEFTFGYAEMMEDQTLDQAIRFHMLAFLKILMEDANNRPWQQVRHYHMTVIQAMEAGQLQWGETERFLAIQRQHSRSGTAINPTPRRVAPGPRVSSAGPTPLYCSQFQSNSCDKNSDHDSPRGFTQHICAYCLRVTGRAISSHGESDCRRKKTSEESKNSE